MTPRRRAERRHAFRSFLRTLRKLVCEECVKDKTRRAFRRAVPLFLVGEGSLAKLGRMSRRENARRCPEHHVTNESR